LTNGRRSRCASRKTGAVARSDVLFWTFTMSNSKGRRSRARSRAAHMHGNSVRSIRAQPQMRTRERTLGSCRSDSLEFCYGPIGSLLPAWRRVFGPPPVSLSRLTLVGSVRSRIGSPVRRTRLGRRPVVRTTRRWRRRARSYMGLSGASGSSLPGFCPTGRCVSQDLRKKSRINTHRADKTQKAFVRSCASTISFEHLMNPSDQ
jgi:hypothetical protein